MKIAFVGKGGSGKTTISALFSRYAVAQGLPVIAIDADINQHMAASLGFSDEQARAIPPLGLEIDRIKDYLRGTNPRVASSSVMIKTTPPGHGSRLLKLQETNPLYDYFQRINQDVRLMAVGPFSEEDLGVKCYHSKVGAVELLLNHLLDKEQEYVVVDMTAGADSFASGLFTRFDMTFIVVEPTLKSISVYDQYRRYAHDYGVRLCVIGNKIQDDKDLEFIREHVGDALLVSLRQSAYVRTMEKGQFLGLDHLESDNTAALQTMLVAVDSCHKDWQKFYQQALEFHVKNGQSWANTAVGHDVSDQIDPSFVLDPDQLL